MISKHKWDAKPSRGNLKPVNLFIAGETFSLPSETGAVNLNVATTGLMSRQNSTEQTLSLRPNSNAQHEMVHEPVILIEAKDNLFDTRFAADGDHQPNKIEREKSVNKSAE